MYVYSQGRRLKRREAGGKGKTIEQAVQVDSVDYDELDSLLGKSLVLCDEAESRLDGLERTWSAAQSSFSSDLSSPNPSYSAPPTAGRSDASPRRRPVQLDYFSASPPPLANSGKVSHLMVELENLKESLASMQQTNSKLKLQLADSIVANKRIETELKRCQEELRTRAQVEISRRYHFIKDADNLISTATPAGIKTLAKGITPVFSYFEVKLPHDETDRVADGKGHAASGQRSVDEEKMAKFTRFAYSDAPSKHLFAEEEKNSKIDPHVVAKWLTEVEPRTYTDAGVILLLAKDILRRLVKKELLFFDSQRSKNEAKIKFLQGKLDTINNAHSKEIAKFELAMENLGRRHIKELNEVRAETSKRISMAKRDAVALKMKNISLQAKVDKVKHFWRDVQSVAPMEQMRQWTQEQKIEVLKALLEQDRVNFHLPEDFSLNCAISDSSMIHWCQQYLKALESKHAGTGVWLQLVCDVFMTNPPYFPKRVLAWYRNGNPEGLSPEDRDALTQLDEKLKGKPAKESVGDVTTLQVMRQDLHTGKQSIWDLASFLLQVPKESAMAELLGFTEEDEEVVLPLWPEFLVWYYREHSHHQMSWPHPSLIQARDTLKASSQWENLILKAHIRENNLFDIDAIHIEKPFSLEETTEVIASIYNHRLEQIQETDPFHQSEAAFPDFVRTTLLKKHVLRGFAGKNLWRLQRSIRAYHKGNSRARVFGKLAGMVNHLRFLESSEGFMMSFWHQLMDADRASQTAKLGRQHSMWLSNKDVNMQLQQQDGRWRGDDSGFKKDPRARIPERRKSLLGSGVQEWSGGGAGWKAERAQLLIVRDGEIGVGKALGRWMHFDRAVRAEDVVEAAMGAFSEKLLPLPGFKGACTEEQLRAMIMPAIVQCARGHKLPLKDLEKLSARPGTGSSARPETGSTVRPTTGGSGRPTTSGSDVSERDMLVLDDAQGDLGRIPEAEDDDDDDDDGSSTPKAEEKSRHHHLDPSDPAVSLDLASDIILDAWYRVLRAQEDFLFEIWQETERIWDWGVNQKSPDLDQLRLFIGIKCGIALREEDLAKLYVDISDFHNNVDGKESASTILRAMYRGRPFVPIEKAKRQRSFRQLDLKPPISTKKSIDPSLSSRGGKFFHNPRANSGLIRRRAST